MSAIPRKIRLIAGLLLLVIALTFWSESHTDASGTHDETRLGAWFSPFYVRTEDSLDSTRPTAGGGSITTTTKTVSSTFTLTSWSWPLLAAGLALLFWPARKQDPGAAT